MRTNDKASQNVAKNHGLLETMEEDRHQPGHNHHHRKILKKFQRVHWCVP